MDVKNAVSNKGLNAAPRFAFGEFVAPARRTRKMFLGVGRNDSDHAVHIYSKSINGKNERLWICPFYVAWRDMLTRCYSEKFLARYPSYVGCSVAQEWLSFSAFRDWMSRQDYVGKSLDKDILVPGNKIYSAETCAFITADLNNFITSSRAARGAWPIGVHRVPSGKFLAQCRDPLSKKKAVLGLFDSPEAAHAAWRSRKHEYACAYADIQTDNRVAEALRVRYLVANGGEQ